MKLINGNMPGTKPLKTWVIIIHQSLDVILLFQRWGIHIFCKTSWTNVPIYACIIKKNTKNDNTSCIGMESSLCYWIKASMPDWLSYPRLRICLLDYKNKRNCFMLVNSDYIIYAISLHPLKDFLFFFHTTPIVFKLVNRWLFINF